MDIYDKPALNEYLAHHGIKGQKWGVRNGPPYPLDAEEHSASEKKAGWRKSLDKSGKKDDNKTTNDREAAEKKGLTNKQKRAIKIGAGIAVGLLAAYGTYKLADSGELHRLAEKGKAFVHGNPPQWRRDPDSAKSDMSADDIFTRVVVRVNPNYAVYGLSGLGTTNNCRRCTFAYELSRRGFDVEATRSLSGTGQDQFGAYNATHNNPVKGGLLGRLVRVFTDEDFKNYSTEAYINRGPGIPISINSSTRGKDIFEALSKNPNGSRGELSVRWTGGNGHSMAWEIVNGKPIIFDCQTREMFDTIESFSLRSSRIATATFTRLDNIELNYDFLMKWVKDFSW